MSTMMLAAVAIYSSVGLLFASRVAALLAWHWHSRARAEAATVMHQPFVGDSPNGGQWARGAFLGAAAAVVWPVTVVAMLGRRWLFAPPAAIKAERWQQRIAELERQLDDEAGDAA